MTKAPRAIEKTWDPDRYEKHAGYVTKEGMSLLAWLAPARGERILDLGCGDGRLTREIAGQGARVVGVDKSASLLSVARGFGLEVYEGDGQRLGALKALGGDFDAVFSNAALHWMGDLDAVASGVAGRLRPEGRFVGEFGAFGNVGAVRAALLGIASALDLGDADKAPLYPWIFPTQTAFRACLERNGFRAERIDVFSRMTPLPTSIDGWIETFADTLLNAQGGRHRKFILARARAILAPILRDENGVWHADYMRLRFHATKDARASDEANA